MALSTELATIIGAQDLYDRFGYWPTFHDAEILHVDLNRTESSHIDVYTWGGTGEIDAKGFYVKTKHIVVEFILDGVSDLELSGFSHQNVIGGLVIQKNNEGFRLKLAPIYGLAGTLDAAALSIHLKPGEP